MAQRSVRFSDTTVKQIHELAKRRGFASGAAVIRYAVERELNGGEGAEQRIAATLNRIRDDLVGIHRVQQTLFAFVDTLAKAVLTGLPEQPAASVARGKERYERFLKSAAAAMQNSSFPLRRDKAQS